jgi:hypothetical protein
VTYRQEITIVRDTSAPVVKFNTPIYEGVWQTRKREVVETEVDVAATGQRLLRVANSTWLDHYVRRRALCFKDPDRNQALFWAGEWYRRAAYRAGLNPYKQRGLLGEKIDGDGERGDYDGEHEARQEIRAADQALRDKCPVNGQRWASVVYYVCVEDYSAMEWARYVARQTKHGIGFRYLVAGLSIMAGIKDGKKMGLTKGTDKA